MSEDKMPNDDLNNEYNQDFSNDFNTGLPEDNSPISDSADVPPAKDNTPEPQKYDFEEYR